MRPTRDGVRLAAAPWRPGRGSSGIRSRAPGTPHATTGECVSHVAQHFGDSQIWDDFEVVTDNLQNAFTQNDFAETKRWIKENNKLLSTIGVVPERIQSFIQEIEKTDGVAKIAGAGSVHGDNAGMVTVFSDHAPIDIAKKYGFELLNIKGEADGARVI